MTVVAITLAVAIAGALALNAWLVHGRISSAEAAADAHVELVEKQAQLERAQFELDVTKKSLKATETRAAAMQEVLSDELDKAPNPDLARDDVAGRVRRILDRWETADRDRALLAGPGAAVPAAVAAETPAAPSVPQAARDVHS
jgi:hypothetical protein